MATIGLYCKAYYVADLARFADWAAYASPDKREPKEGEFLFLHDTFTVTDGIFTDEQVVFDHVTPAWQAFCRDELRFELPDGVEPRPAD